jgi:NAD+ synthase (glutamine-hydrolysing)
MEYGFVKVGAALPVIRVGDCMHNAKAIIELMHEAQKEQVAVVCFPELAVTAYTCGDLFFQQHLLDSAEQALGKIAEASSGMKLLVFLGCPLRRNNKLYNTAVCIQDGKILAVVPKTYLPNKHEFYEKRWFSSAGEDTHNKLELLGQQVPFGSNILLCSGQLKVAAEICEDLWAPIPMSSRHCLAGANLIVNLSAANELSGKNRYLKQLLSQQSVRCLSAYVYASCGWGESSTDLIFAGNGYVLENGVILAESKRFHMEKQLICSEIDVECLLSERLANDYFVEESLSYTKLDFHFVPDKKLKLSRTINPHPFIPAAGNMNESCEEIFSIQVAGLAQRLHQTHISKLVLGISGGLDSTLALMVAVKAMDKLGLDRKNIHGITMPGFGTSQRTYRNANDLMNSLGVSIKEIDIKAACTQHFKDIGHDSSVHDATYENTQARERTQILMDYANKIQALVVGTGNLSELALGWATYNGDHMSMYGVNTGVPKTLVSCLLQWLAGHTADPQIKNTLLDIIDTPISPELLPLNSGGKLSQITEEAIGPYELHDFFLFYLIRYGFRPKKILFLATQAFENRYKPNVIRQWLKVFIERFFKQQYKRSCLPDGPKVGRVNLSPRGGWRMPSDAECRLWLLDLDD